ncbi:hypothetical protein Q760_13065 [Cellulomonas cellasea DSM 20118]|uniref:Uncharacterized protein n=1 Tax=Cellulomonas cellasea DSM 20118 TaxID=1408250 RepID=A0A0A0B9N2_9CELL|nr:hypothetical protein Q760_13065 [Cellulomonas cellasea DSM 20118]
MVMGLLGSVRVVVGRDGVKRSAECGARAGPARDDRRGSVVHRRPLGRRPLDDRPASAIVRGPVHRASGRLNIVQAT